MKTIALKTIAWKTIAAIALLLAGCASAPPPPPPTWDTVPTSVVDALCTRLRMDAFATGRMTIVRVTQPLVTSESLIALRGFDRRAFGTPKTVTSVQPINRAIPISLDRSVCAWQPIEAFERSKHMDEMVVELSAPVVNPEMPSQSGLFVRVTLGGENASWYWISLAHVNGEWVPGFVNVLFQ